MTIAEALTWAAPQLRKSCERPRYEAELLLAHHLGENRPYLYTHDDEVLSDPEAFRALVHRREAHEPYEYIAGRVSFYDLVLGISPGALIPRPETELLVDRAAEIIAREGVERLVEIGVGSGAISIVLARKFPRLHIVATDISDAALAVAHDNIERFGLSDRITLLKSHLMDGITTEVQMVVSNPPYIANGYLPKENVVAYEPHTALFGGEKGDELLREIVLETHRRGIGWLVCEMGYDQCDSMQSLFSRIGVEYRDFYKDLSGLDRGFVAKFEKGKQ